VIYLGGNISDDEYADQTRKLRVAIDNAKRLDQENRPVNTAGLRQFLQTDFRSVYNTLNKEDQRRLWRTVIQEIQIDGTNVTGIIPRV
jgi:hypothetical protein